MVRALIVNNNRNIDLLQKLAAHHSAQTHTPHPSREPALGRKLRDCLVPRDRGRQKHFQKI